LWSGFEVALGQRVVGEVYQTSNNFGSAAMVYVIVGSYAACNGFLNLALQFSLEIVGEGQDCKTTDA
jgi:hypothetical protein